MLQLPRGTLAVWREYLVDPEAGPPVGSWALWFPQILVLEIRGAAPTFYGPEAALMPSESAWHTLTQDAVACDQCTEAQLRVGNARVLRGPPSQIALEQRERELAKR